MKQEGEGVESKATREDIGINNVLDYFCPGWNQTKITTQTFDDIFQLEGIPLSWFYKRLFCVHTAPPQLGLRSLVKKYIQGEKIDQSRKMRLKTKMLIKGFYTNELLKLKVQPRRRNKSNTKNKVLFLTYFEHIHPTTTEIFRIQRVIDLLLRENTIEPVVLAVPKMSTPFYQLLQKNIPEMVNTVPGYITPAIKKEARAMSRSLAGRWRSLSIENKEKIFGGLWKAVQYALDFYFSPAFIFFVALYYQTFLRMLQEENIKAVVITSHNGIFERCLNAAAHRLGIKTVLLQHGAALGSINPELKQPYTIAVHSEQYVKQLVRAKVPNTSVIITGPIIFDTIYPYLQKSHNSPYNNDKPKEILILTVPMVEQDYFSSVEYFNYIRKIITECTISPNTKIIIKLHPREKMLSKYKNMIRKEKFVKVQVIQQGGSTALYELIAKADLVINFSSTVALEALILDKRVITLLFPSFSNPFNKVLHESGATLEVSINDNLSKAITTLWSDTPGQAELARRRRDFIKEYCGVVDGRAAERVAAFIQKEIKI